ncbi:NUDIX domain-containing protein [Patescibacteria group bacterium]|nr:NUDIX domain-containing protein [Patescibacteria group bacterium]MCG2702008.1 NUDIX domain-containing protein [Candidatus Parcubacteria bacterium]MBU4264823.1 NUDIX domain-containing protein [Patescibacteria group bacterium]MBU4389845.1 NUDIX domain-containing protein [Patescibacteria group bacterium]MBU4397561.1 NUDIX domain-containing protein [Patescibacteria group bacterium]
MKPQETSVRARLIIIKNNKLLTQFRQKDNYYHYIGGHLEYGETLLEACLREIKEECGGGVEFKFKKILYIRDFIWPQENEHSLELFILGDINKFEELEKLPDPQHSDGSVWLTWLDINNLPDNLYPNALSANLIKDFKNGFPNQGEYVGKM